RPRQGKNILARVLGSVPLSLHAPTRARRAGQPPRRAVSRPQFGRRATHTTPSLQEEATMKTHTTKFTVQIELAKSNTIGKLAEGHLAFKDGPLDGLTLGGFTVWTSKSGDAPNVTFPGRPYTNTKG